MYKKIFFGLLLIVLIALLSFFVLRSNLQPPSKPATNLLSVPVLIDSRDFNNDIQIGIQDGTHEFFDGIKSQTKGFDGGYLGPTIRLYNAEDTRIRFTNALDEETSVHGHGLHVPGAVDGGPQNTILPGEVWDITLPIKQQASTNWYHPHLHGKTAEQVHAGLAGLYIVEDENSLNLPLPREYGVDDIPLIIQDRSFTDGVMNVYEVTDQEMMNGKREDTLVVNGTIDPYVEVPQGWVRLRLLNASNARYYGFHLENNESFYKIATEGGFLEEPVEIKSMQMSPGERNEIMIDMSDGKTRDLLARFVPLDDDWYEENFTPTKRVLEIRIDSEVKGTGEPPRKTNTIVRLDPDDAVVTRELELEMEAMEEMVEDEDMLEMHSMFSINGKPMDMSRIDESVIKGDVEIWSISRDEMDHPFHVHGTSFLILSQNGREPAPEDRGWKDTVDIGWGETELIMRFDHEATEEYPYMYHCHILEHEDGGMMGQFTVQ